MRKMIENLNQTSYRKVIWLLAISETLHNLEEAVWMPGWSETAGMWQLKVGATEFRIAVILITLLIYGVVLYFSKNNNELSKFLMGGALIMILFNVFVPHLLATIFMQNYAPGVISGVLLNVPVILYLTLRGLKEGYYKIKTMVLAGLCFGLITIPLLQLFYLIGRVIDKVI